MNPDLVVQIARDALGLTLVLLAILLLPGLGVGLLVSMFQAATQINEMTLSFIPKLLVTVLVVLVGGPLILRLVVDYSLELFHGIPGLIG